MLFLMIILYIPLYIYFIWGIYEPEEAMLFGNRWRFKELPEFTDFQIQLFKYKCIFAIIFLTVIIIIMTIVTFRG